MNLLLASESVSASSVVSEVGESASSWSWNLFWSRVFTWIQTSGVKLLVGLIVLFICFGIINSVSRAIKNRMIKRGRDMTVVVVTYRIIRYGLKIALFIVFLGYVGIDTAGIGTIIASLSVAVGLAVQGSLSNLAGWFVIIVMRPFKLGDYIEAQGNSGTVEDIRVFYTYIATPDNKVIMIPNGALANGNIINYSVKDLRRVDNVFQVSYGDDVSKAIEIIENILEANTMVLKDPEYFVKVSCCGAHGIDITVRVWVKNGDYWTVYFNLVSEVKSQFDANGITVPYNQIDVHMIEADKKDEK